MTKNWHTVWILSMLYAVAAIITQLFADLTQFESTIILFTMLIGFMFYLLIRAIEEKR